MLCVLSASVQGLEEGTVGMQGSQTLRELLPGLGLCYF